MSLCVPVRRVRAAGAESASVTSAKRLSQEEIRVVFSPGVRLSEVSAATATVIAVGSGLPTENKKKKEERSRRVEENRVGGDHVDALCLRTLTGPNDPDGLVKSPICRNPVRPAERNPSVLAGPDGDAMVFINDN